MPLVSMESSAACLRTVYKEIHGVAGMSSHRILSQQQRMDRMRCRPIDLEEVRPQISGLGSQIEGPESVLRAQIPYVVVQMPSSSYVYLHMRGAVHTRLIGNWGPGVLGSWGPDPGSGSRSWVRVLGIGVREVRSIVSTFKPWSQIDPIGPNP